jgi:hypothetical protein
MNVISTRPRPHRLEEASVKPAALAVLEQDGIATSPVAAGAAPDGFDHIRTTHFSAPRSAPAPRHPRIPRDAASAPDEGPGASTKDPAAGREIAVPRSTGSGSERPKFESLDQKEQALEAIRKDPRVYFDIHGTLASDKDIREEAKRLTKADVLEAVRENPRNYTRICTNGVLDWIDPSFQVDPEVLSAAAQVSKSQALEAIRKSQSYFFMLREPIGSPLASDPDIVFEVARDSVRPDRLLGELPEALKQDRAWMLRMLRHNVWMLKLVPDALLQDPKLATEAAMTFPPILDDPKLSGRRDALLAASPELRQRYASVKQALQELRIDDPMRLRNAALLDEVLRNRLEARAAGDTRPTAVLIYAKSDTDPNGTLRTHNIDELTKYYRVMFYEARTEHDFIDAIKDGARTGAAEIVVVSGHGNQKLLNLGEAKYSGTQEEYQVDLGDEEQLRAERLEQYMQPDARVFLESCYQGSGKADEENQVKMLARVLPGREVFGVAGPMFGGSFPLDEQGRVTGVSWWRTPSFKTSRARVDPGVSSGAQEPAAA